MSVHEFVFSPDIDVHNAAVAIENLFGFFDTNIF